MASPAAVFVLFAPPIGLRALRPLCATARQARDVRRLRGVPGADRRHSGTLSTHCARPGRWRRSTRGRRARRGTARCRIRTSALGVPDAGAACRDEALAAGARDRRAVRGSRVPDAPVERPARPVRVFGASRNAAARQRRGTRDGIIPVERRAQDDDGGRPPLGVGPPHVHPHVQQAAGLTGRGAPGVPA